MKCSVKSRISLDLNIVGNICDDVSTQFNKLYKNRSSFFYVVIHKCWIIFNSYFT